MEKWLNLKTILEAGLKISVTGPGMTAEDRCRRRAILFCAPSIVKPFSGCLENLNRSGMNRFSWNPEFLVSGSSSQTFAPRPWSVYKWNYLDGDPSVDVFLQVACWTGQLKTELSPHSGLILTWWGTGGGDDRHWLWLLSDTAELKFHLLVVANINPVEEIKKIKTTTDKKACYSWCFSSNIVTPGVHTIYKKKEKKKKAFLQCLSSVSTSTVLKLTCWHLKESAKNVIFLEYQNRDTE